MLLKAALQALNAITAGVLKFWAFSWITVGFWKVFLMTIKGLAVLAPIGLLLYLVFCDDHEFAEEVKSE